MAIPDLSGKLATINATPRLTTLDAALQASLGMAHAPVSSRLQRVDKLGESSVARQAVDAPNQPVFEPKHEAPTRLAYSSEPVLMHLSKTAALLASLQPGSREQAPSRATIPGGQPILDEPPRYPASLAVSLQTRLQDSGLFYESHLLSWYHGRYSTERLAQEPQSRLTSQPAYEAPAERMAGDQAGTNPVPNEAAKLIAQQLQLLDKPSLQWSVDVWPGQSATLLIEEEAPRTTQSQSSFSTHIQLDFPRMGRIQIDLRMDALGLAVKLDAEEEHALTPLLRQRDQCVGRLASTGCHLREFSIGRTDANA